MKTKHWIAFLSLGAIWSSSFLWIKIAVAELGPITLVAFRVLFGLLFGLIFIVVRRIPMLRSLEEWKPLIILGISNVAIPFFLISWGEQHIDSGIAAILDATVPLFTVVAAHYILHDDKMNVPKVAGLLIGFAGVVILMSKDIGESPSSVLGQIAVVVACMFYAGSNIYARKVTENTPAIFRSIGPLLSSTLIMWLAVPVFEAPIHIPALPITWLAVIWLGVLGSGVAFIISYYLLHEIGPTRATMVTYLFPLGGVTLGAIFLKEQITWQVIVGGTLIVLSLIIANWKIKDQT